MASTSSSSTSPSASFTPINSIEINFQAKEKEARRIFADPKIQEYALSALTEIQTLHRQIIIEVHEYNAGNVAYRKAIDEKIKIIFNNYVAKENFPRTFVATHQTALKAFFSPLKKEYKRVRKELYRSENRVEKVKKALEKKKNDKLSLLLYDEQEKISSLKEVLAHFFNMLKVNISDKNPKPTIYFAYAWPTDERMTGEYWVQPFLKRLQSHLKIVGFSKVHFDIVSNRYGANINEFMSKAHESDYVLLFGTESLKNQYDEGISAVCTEFIEILRKRKSDVQEGLRRVFPILISGNHKTAFPPEFERFITVRDWRKEGYLNHFQTLFLELNRLAPETYLENTHSFLEESIAVFPREASKIRNMQEWYSRTREQINHSRSLEEVLQCPISLPSEATPSDQQILMTSRPGSVEFNQDAEFETLCFNDRQILKVISRHFSQMEKADKPSAVEKESRYQPIFSSERLITPSQNRENTAIAACSQDSNHSSEQTHFDTAWELCKERNWSLLLSQREEWDEIRDKEGRSLLQMAIVVNDIALAKEIISNEIAIHARDALENNALHYAAMGGHTELLGDFSSHLYLQEPNIHGLTPLHFAAMHGRRGMIAALLEQQFPPKLHELLFSGQFCQ